jgi:hypothetical protein
VGMAATALSLVKLLQGIAAPGALVVLLNLCLRPPY